VKDQVDKSGKKENQRKKFKKGNSEKESPIGRGGEEFPRGSGDTLSRGPPNSCTGQVRRGDQEKEKKTLLRKRVQGREEGRGFAGSIESSRSPLSTTPHGGFVRGRRELKR